MTTETKPINTLVDSDLSFERVLVRLNARPELTRGTLRRGDTFCVMGIMADESGLGEWSYDDKIDQYDYCYSDTKESIDYSRITEYYGIDMEIYILGLPENILQLLANHYGLKNTSELSQRNTSMPLWMLNDALDGKDYQIDVLCGVLDHVRRNRRK